MASASGREVASGEALYFFFYSIGLGKTVGALVVGHVLITLPFVFLAVSSVLYNFDTSLEEAARSLGANKFTTPGSLCRWSSGLSHQLDLAVSDYAGGEEL